MKRAHYGILSVVAFLVLSCGQASHGYPEAQSEAAESDIAETTLVGADESSDAAAPETYISSSAAIENPNDSARKMIRTADIKFKVKNVLTATYAIENIIVQHNGFVQSSQLASQIDYTESTDIKVDSTLQTIHYTVYNTLVLRVPSAQLDASLKEIAQYVDFMDYRNIKATDVTLDLLSKKLEQNRLSRYDSRMSKAIDAKGKKLDDVSDAEDNLLSKQAQADQAKLENLQTYDQIKYSTITLNLYQNPSVKYETIAKGKTIEQYKTPYSTRFGDALNTGWLIIVEIAIFLVNIWSIILVGFIVLWGVIYYRKRKNESKKE